MLMCCAYSGVEREDSLEFSHVLFDAVIHETIEIHETIDATAHYTLRQSLRGKCREGFAYLVGLGRHPDS